MGSNVITEAAFLLFAVGVVVYVVILYNELVRLRNDNDRAWANIDVLLKQRHDEIPNLVEIVKGYMQQEQQTLVAVTQARAASMNAASIGQKAAADLRMTGALRGLFAVAENYPQLKANENFLKLQMDAHQRTGRAHRRPARVLQRRRQYLQHAHRANPRGVCGQLYGTETACFFQSVGRGPQAGRGKISRSGRRVGGGSTSGFSSAALLLVFAVRFHK